MTRLHDERPIKRTNPSGKTVWIARFTARDGRRKSAGTFPFQRDARAAIEAAYEREYGGPRERGTVGAYAKTWIERHPRAERTNVTNAGRVRAVLDITVDGKPFRDWPLSEVRRWHATRILDVLLRDHGRAASGARAVLSVLSAMFEDAMGDGFAEVNPFLGLRVRATDARVRKPPRAVSVLSWEQMHSFAAHGGSYEPMLRTLADCGLRLGELVALERADLHDGVLEVRRHAWKGVVADGTKTGVGRRVPVPPALGAMLAAMPKRIDTRVLFPAPDGTVWKERDFYKRVWDPAAERAGFRPRPHDFRHSWVSLMRAAGVDPADLAAASGHTVETATARYTHSVGQSFETMRGVVG